LSNSDLHDVIVVGGGPAGSAMAWALARRGVRVAVVERATFPREKVCGDFVEPAGLRILEAMGCWEALEVSSPLPITATRVYFGPRLVYRGAVPYYQAEHSLPPYGYVVPRHVLDTLLMQRARAVSATVYEGCAAAKIWREDGLVHVGVRAGKTSFTLHSRLIVGADGAESIVARTFGLSQTNRAHISISQRAYVEGAAAEGGEATVWFDEDIVPGYGWMFPISGGRANIGVGILSETCHRHGHSVPKAFVAAIERLRIRHPGCTRIKLVSKPIGGVVKMYGGIGPNHFDGGVLVGDAGSFADPMTGEGITQGMESALIASSTILRALERGRFDAAFLSQFERDFRRYFDPSMLFLDFCAALMRNWHFREFWMQASMRGFERAKADPDFARVAGAGFGGLNVQPLAIVGQLWWSILRYLGEGTLQAVGDLFSRGTIEMGGMFGDLATCWSAWRRSIADDPGWHAAWLADVAKRAARLEPSLRALDNPRVRGPFGSMTEGFASGG
jgi:geranylgeranyl reductase family protein